MKLDTLLLAEVTDAAVKARLLADLGLDGVFTFEGVQDPFFPLALAAHETDLDVYTNVALAFPRSPMTTAYQAWDLQKLSGGRFLLGLGTQVRANIERRYSATFGRPVAHLREFVEAVRAIFGAWQDGERLDFRGDYYTLTLMQPTFDPGPNPFGPPPILLGALGPKMTHMTAEVADGLLVHPFNTPRFLDEQLIPNLRAGLQASGRRLGDLQVVCDVIVATGRTEEEMADAVAATRGLLGFYGSTPAYRSPLEPYGWDELQPELNRLSKQGQWDDMAHLVDDEMLATLAIVGPPDEIGAKARERFGDLADRLGFYLPYAAEPDLIGEVVDSLRTPSES
jgi:probable F420-dependent oxidoreductase